MELRGTDSSSSGGAGSSSRDIPAAVAVAGRVAASQELPYMTPPLEVIHDIDTPTVDQSHFSGDSQDSSKGYTSISVREPLQHICGGQDTSRVLTSHYATVSDDSDDNMYAAIAEPSSAHAPYGSETYAQIEVSTDMVVAAAVTIPQQHSRQPSSSSCTSSTANVGSPKPEKRQANSPLPPPPQRTIEDMYAKVHKTPRRRLDEDPTTSVPHEQDKERPSNALTEATAQDSEPVPDSDLDHCYETLSKASKKLSLHKSDVSDVDVGYERIRNRTAINTELKTVEHGYEQLSHSRISSETDPNYETLRPQNNNNHDHAPLDILDGYSVVKKPPKHKHDPAHYATLQQKSTESESEPNYESVKYLDVTLNEPPYERLGDSQYSDLSESSPSKNSHSTPDYERIRGGDNSKSSDNSEGSSKLPTDIRNEQKTQDTLHLDNINVEEIIEKNTDENMYFQV